MFEIIITLIQWIFNQTNSYPTSNLDQQPNVNLQHLQQLERLQHLKKYKNSKPLIIQHKQFNRKKHSKLGKQCSGIPQKTIDAAKRILQKWDRIYLVPISKVTYQHFFNFDESELEIASPVKRKQLSSRNSSSNISISRGNSSSDSSSDSNSNSSNNSNSGSDSSNSGNCNSSSSSNGNDNNNSSKEKGNLPTILLPRLPFKPIFAMNLGGLEAFKERLKEFNKKVAEREKRELEMEMEMANSSVPKQESSFTNTPNTIINYENVATPELQSPLSSNTTSLSTNSSILFSNDQTYESEDNTPMIVDEITSSNFELPKQAFTIITTSLSNLVGLVDTLITSTLQYYLPASYFNATYTYNEEEPMIVDEYLSSTLSSTPSYSTPVGYSTHTVPTTTESSNSMYTENTQSAPTLEYIYDNYNQPSNNVCYEYEEYAMEIDTTTSTTAYTHPFGASTHTLNNDNNFSYYPNSNDFSYLPNSNDFSLVDLLISFSKMYI